jgi:hypothetical protein
MKGRFERLKPTYGQRWQVETVNSMVKRRIGSALRARTEDNQCGEMILRAITHNVMIIRIQVFYRAGRHRFPIAVLMAGVLLLALGLTVLRSGSFAWFRALYAVTLLALLLAIIAARYRPVREGAFWFGYAVFGWGYFLIGIGPWTEWTTTTITGQGEHIQARANPLLPTEGLMAWLADYHAGNLRPTLTGKNVTVSREVYQAHAKALASYTEVREGLIGIGHLMLLTSAE